MRWVLHSFVEELQRQKLTAEALSVLAEARGGLPPQDGAA